MIWPSFDVAVEFVVLAFCRYDQPWKCYSWSEVLIANVRLKTFDSHYRLQGMHGKKKDDVHEDHMHGRFGSQFLWGSVTLH